jgi:hypothetical protein
LYSVFNVIINSGCPVCEDGAFFSFCFARFGGVAWGEIETVCDFFPGNVFIMEKKPYVCSVDKEFFFQGSIYWKCPVCEDGAFFFPGKTVCMKKKTYICGIRVLTVNLI